MKIPSWVRTKEHTIENKNIPSKAIEAKDWKSQQEYLQRIYAFAQQNYTAKPFADISVLGSLFK